jgi:hypothetical protein
VKRRKRAEGSPTILLTIRFRTETLDDFIEEYYPDVMKGGMFIRTGVENPLLELGVYVQLRFELADGRPHFTGRGLVAWIQRRGNASGVGIQFVELSETAMLIYQDMLAKRQARTRRQRPGRESEEFSEAPTLPVGPPPLFV